MSTLQSMQTIQVEEKNLFEPPEEEEEIESFEKPKSPLKVNTGSEVAKVVASPPRLSLKGGKKQAELQHPAVGTGWFEDKKHSEVAESNDVTEIMRFEGFQPATSLQKVESKASFNSIIKVESMRDEDSVIKFEDMEDYNQFISKAEKNKIIVIDD